MVVIEDVVLELGRIGNWVQAVGLLVVFWVVVNIINVIVNRKKRKLLYRIEDRLVMIEKKIDKLVKK